MLLQYRAWCPLLQVFQPLLIYQTLTIYQTSVKSCHLESSMEVFHLSILSTRSSQAQLLLHLTLFPHPSPQISLLLSHGTPHLPLLPSKWTVHWLKSLSHHLASPLDQLISQCLQIWLSRDSRAGCNQSTPVTTQPSDWSHTAFHSAAKAPRRSNTMKKTVLNPICSILMIGERKIKNHPKQTKNKFNSVCNHPCSLCLKLKCENLFLHLLLQGKVKL